MRKNTWQKTLVAFWLILGALNLVACHPAKTPLSAMTQTSSPTRIPLVTELPDEVEAETTATLVTQPIYSGKFKMVIRLDEVLTGQVSGLVPTVDGLMWLVSDQEVFQVSGDNLSLYMEAFEGDFAGVDATGRVWVVSEDTALISAWNGQSWTAYGEANGWIALSGNYGNVSGGQSDPQGRIWFTTSQDVRSFDGVQWTIYTRDQMGMQPPAYDDLMPVYKLHVLESGEVWVGECDWGGPGPFGGGGARWFVGGEWRGKTSPAASGCVNNIADDNLERIWVGVDSSLWQYHPVTEDWVEFSPPATPIPEMRFGFIDSLVVDENNEAWVELVLCGGASCYGNSVLYHLRDTQWIQVGSVGEYDSGYWGPIFDFNGTPWVYWEGGIYRINEDVPELVSSLAGRFGVRSSDGRVWFVAPHEKSDALWVLNEQ